MKHAIATLLLLSPLVVWANSNCDKPRNDFDGLYCLNKVYIEADKELNEKYGKLRPMLDETGKKILRDSQLRWMKQRDRECSRREDTRFFVNLECAANTTIERAEFLQSRIRECSSAGCQNSKLDQ
jgi:uncharacterized protein YecT (DUF1311 family)